MKKSILGAAMVALIAPLVLATGVHAADTDTALQQTTTATVSFTGFPDNPKGPVDPSNPSNPTNPDTPNTPSDPTKNNPDQPVNPNSPTEGTGALWLVTAPSFAFGSHKVTEVGPFNPQFTQGKNTSGLYYAQVSDTRTGGLGWNLSVSATPFTGTTPQTANSTLSGATLLLGASKNITNSTEATTTGYNATPVANAIGQASPILQATTGHGNGITSINWQPSDISLSVPANTAVSGTTYTSTLTWTLSSTQPAVIPGK